MAATTSLPSLAGKVALVTGANSGLGTATALGLARLGAAVVMVCRDAGRGEAARADIVAASGSRTADLLLADLSSQAEVRRLAQEFRAGHDRLDVLVNCAGGVFWTRQESADGIEYSLAFNHLAPFLLTNLLLDTLTASAPARVVNVTTQPGRRAAIDLDDIQFTRRPYSAFRAYIETKLANILFTYELARRLAGSGVTANCVHPGIFKSNFGSGAGQPAAMRLLTPLSHRFMAEPERAAERVLYLAAAPEMAGVSGKYYGDRQELRSSPQSYDEAAARRLWEVSAALTGLA